MLTDEVPRVHTQLDAEHALNWFSRSELQADGFTHDLDVIKWQ